MTIGGTLFNWARFRQFATVGIIGAIVDLSISVPLALFTDLPPEIAKFLGAEAAIILMFTLNDRWTFADARSATLFHWLRRLVKSNLVRSGGIVIQLTAVFLLTRIGMTLDIGGIDVWPVIVMPIAIGCGFIFNYVGETLITWRMLSKV